MSQVTIDKNVIYGGDYEEPAGYNSIGDIILNYLKDKEDKLALINGVTDTKWSAREILNASIEVAKALFGAGIKKDDVVSIVSENRLEFIVIAFGSFLLNAVVAPLNPSYSERELKHGLSLSQPKIIFVSSSAIKNVISVCKDLSSIKQIIMLDESPSNSVISLRTFIQSHAGVNLNIHKRVRQSINMKNQTAVILLSSGTTGIPKGCEITQENMIACLSAYQKRTKFLKKFKDESMILNMTPWFHVMGLVNIFSVLLLKTYSTVFLSRFDPKLFFNAIEKYQVISVSIPPPVVVFISKTPLIHNYDLSCLRVIFCGAAPLKQETEEQVKDLFKRRIFVLQAYGMTETTAGIIASFAGNEAPGSIGDVEEGIYAKIVDENGAALGPHKVGEVCCKGNRIMKGYLNDEKATAEMIDKDGWLKTGDMGYYDEKNRFYIVDRLKELIKYKAFQVPPAELEGLLLSNPKVKDCGVIGIADDDAGELPFAFVVKQPGVDLSGDEVKDFIKKNASNAKWLRGGVKFIDEIPKNPSGKILRRELRELFKSMQNKL